LPELLHPENAIGVEDVLYGQSNRTVPQRVHAAFEYMRDGMSHEVRWMLQRHSKSAGSLDAIAVDDDASQGGMTTGLAGGVMSDEEREDTIDFVKTTLAEVKTGG
jgi:trans-2-enoyl-CoA reductase